MMDSLAPYGQSIALVAAIIVAFGVYLSNRQGENEAARHRDELLSKNEQLLERADENARLQAELRTAAEETMRQVTGEGGYGVVIPYFRWISPEIVKREGIVIPEIIPTTFGILNNSEAPVIGPLVIISQRVPVGEGSRGSDRKELFRGRLEDIYPHMGPHMLNAHGTIARSHDNWFDVYMASRAATVTQSIVVSWNGETWETDYELRQNKDADRNVEEKVLHTIRDDFPFLNDQRR